MIKRQEAIAGYDGFKNEDLISNENPFACNVQFKVVSEEMPALTRAAGKIVRQNFVWIFKEFDLGKSKLSRRIKDKVHFDETLGTWKVDMLAQPKSDIEQYTQQWNAFVAGNKDNVVGTPLALLFKNDPSRVEEYAKYNVKFVEQLAAFTDQNAADFGMGGLDDKKKAMGFLSRIEEAAPGAQIEAAMADKDDKIAYLQTQIAELSSKMTALVSASDGKDLTPSQPRPRGRPPLDKSQQVSA